MTQAPSSERGHEIVRIYVCKLYCTTFVLTSSTIHANYVYTLLRDNQYQKHAGLEMYSRKHCATQMYV